MLAGISVDYYAKMERGNLSGVSLEILEALARALQLDVAETVHLHALARLDVQRHNAGRPVLTSPLVRPTMQRFLDTIVGTPVHVMNARKDLLASNALGRAVFTPILDDEANGRNNARFIFLNPASHVFYPEWEAGARSTVASLRAAGAQRPHDTGLTGLIGELVTRSDTFRAMWAQHDVRFHLAGTKRIHHPVVGDLEFAFEAFAVGDGAGDETMYAWTVEPGSPTADRLQLLGSLTASDQAVS